MKWDHMPTDKLARAVDRVLRSDNCTGCGGCALVSARIRMEMGADGFVRPNVETEQSLGKAGRGDAEAAKFRLMCPGVRVTAPPNEISSKIDPIFGAYVSVWEAIATDPAVRRAGSSGGVLTALSTWLIATGRAKNVTGVASDSSTPKRTVPVQIMSREQALSSSGSRYAPVSTLTAWQDDPTNALVAKPCEIAAAQQLHAANNTATEMPVTLSFFCAGTPSQNATDGLIRELGLDPDAITTLKYRGDGWPGAFVARAQDREASLSYDDSWGKHLGRQLQWRCKICVDGTGAHADISVGDFWDADENGYPVFAEGDGNSVAIARTVRGDQLLRQAASDGAIVISPTSLEKVSTIQPLQVQRRSALIGRLAGRLLAGNRIPRYRGFRLLRLASRNIVPNGRGAVGTFLRSFRGR